ncbi:hypothetical protein NDU88_002098 [Pleurodeles waltl]|uniref:Uncharacterized protein n=1 Tax=Pleurodeles waltl TaxID=8319 RepID=A0AAV7VDC2_PLEWA|nr:hypothetical protein NDU88_002098 [Pleurodeles waltl]
MGKIVAAALDASRIQPQLFKSPPKKVHPSFPFAAVGVVLGPQLFPLRCGDSRPGLFVWDLEYRRRSLHGSYALVIETRARCVYLDLSVRRQETLCIVLRFNSDKFECVEF